MIEDGTYIIEPASTQSGREMHLDGGGEKAVISLKSGTVKHLWEVTVVETVEDPEADETTTYHTVVCKKEYGKALDGGDTPVNDNDDNHPQVLLRENDPGNKKLHWEFFGIWDEELDQGHYEIIARASARTLACRFEAGQTEPGGEQVWTSDDTSGNTMLKWRVFKPK